VRPTASQHPSAADLAAFTRGALSPTAAAWVGQHLDECSICRAAANDPYGTIADPPTGPGSATRPEAVNPVLSDLPPALSDHPRYRILRPLGRGGMGVVYLAEHRVMERPVAVKVISRSLVDRPEALERFHREVRAAARLDHPNIVKAYDAETAGDLQLLAMEYVNGRNLADLLEKKGKLPVAKACHYVRQAALGLQHAYERGMVHRDLKPHNLMLTPQGVVKILDFGLAKLASERSRPGGGLTQENVVMGTPEYMAPEQAANTKAADIRADIYALGCTLYCLLTGRPPFAGDVLEVLVGHSQSVPPPVESLRPDVPPRLAAVVARLLAKKPAERPQTPKEVAEALAPFVKAGVKSKVPETPPVAAAAARPRRRWPIPAAVAAAVLTGAGLWAGGVFHSKGGGEGGDPKPTVKRAGVEELYQLIAELRILSYPQTPLRAKTRQHALNEAQAALDVVEAGASIDDPAVVRRLDEVLNDVADLKAVSMIGAANKKALADAERILVEKLGRPAPAPPVGAPTFVSLFNGRDLDGWEPFPGGTAEWVVEDGVIVGRGGRGYLFSKRGDYGDFQVHVEAKASPFANSGVFFRMPYSNDPRTGYEAQIEAGTDPYPTGSLYGIVTAPRNLVSPDEWFTMDVICVGPRIEILINGKEVVRHTEMKPRSLKGYLALQQQMPGREIRFRKVEMKELK
jgi:predicted Ser/Thr protein kinase